MIVRVPVTFNGKQYNQCYSDIPFCDMKVVGEEGDTLYNTILEPIDQPGEYEEVKREGVFGEDMEEYFDNRDPRRLSKEDLIEALRYFGIYL